MIVEVLNSRGLLTCQLLSNIVLDTPQQPKIHSLPLFGTETSDVRGIQSIFFKHIFLKILFSSLLIVPSTLIAPSCLLERVPRADLHLRARIYLFYFFFFSLSVCNTKDEGSTRENQEEKKKKNRPQSELTIR